eukprot:4010256-Prymnesium_polylepis.1
MKDGEGRDDRNAARDRPSHSVRETHANRKERTLPRLIAVMLICGRGGSGSGRVARGRVVYPLDIG